MQVLPLKKNKMHEWIVTIDQDEGGWYIVECPEIPGCVSQGRTEEEEVLNNIGDAISECLAVRAEVRAPTKR